MQDQIRGHWGNVHRPLPYLLTKCYIISPQNRSIPQSRGQAESGDCHMLIQRSVSIIALPKRTPLSARSQKNKLASPYLPSRATSPSSGSPEPVIVPPILFVLRYHIWSFVHYYEALFPKKIFTFTMQNTCGISVRLYGALFRACSPLAHFPNKKHDKSRCKT